MYEKISKSDFPYIHRALGAANYVRKIHESPLSIYPSLLPDLYAECIVGGWEAYSNGGNGDEVFMAACRRGRRFMYNEFKMQKYSFPSQFRHETIISVKTIARAIRNKSNLNLKQCVRKAYIVRERLVGVSNASIARELSCDDANVLYHYNSVIHLFTSVVVLRQKPWQKKGRRGRWARRGNGEK